MKFLGLVLLFLSLINQVTPKEVSGIFTSFNSLTWSDAGNYGYRGPANPAWQAKLSWSLEGKKVNPGDTFTLTMPCVFKFVTTQPSIDLAANGITYATCTFHSGEEFTTFSTVSCIVSDALTSSTQAFGTVSIPFSFNIGGSGSDVDLTDSTCFTTGSNTVTFKDGDNELSIQTNFEQTKDSQSGLITNARVIPSLGQLSHLVVAPDCPNGYASGELGIYARDNSVTINCENIHIGITDKLNAWNNPTNSNGFTYTKKCDSNGFSISFKNVPTGYRPFLDSLINAATDYTFTISYISKYTCATGDYHDKSITKNWAPYKNGLADSDGAVVFVTTSTYLESTTGVTTLPFDSNNDKSKTIEVLVPIPTTTVTESYVGVTTSYTTISAPIGGTATVIVDEPYHITTTVYTSWTGEGTTSYTVTASTDSVDTVYVETPVPNPTVTTTEYGSVSAATTYIETASHGGTDTVHVIEPINPTVTTTEYGSVSAATTITYTNPPGETDTVLVIDPLNPTVTTTEYEDVSVATTYTETATHGGTDTVHVIEPINPTVTTTEYWSHSYITTITETFAPGLTDSVIIEIPISSEVPVIPVSSSFHYYNTTIVQSSSNSEQYTITVSSDTTDTVVVPCSTSVESFTFVKSSSAVESSKFSESPSSIEFSTSSDFSSSLTVTDAETKSSYSAPNDYSTTRTSKTTDFTSVPCSTSTQNKSYYEDVTMTSLMSSLSAATIEESTSSASINTEATISSPAIESSGADVSASVLPVGSESTEETQNISESSIPQSSGANESFVLSLSAVTAVSITTKSRYENGISSSASVETASSELESSIHINVSLTVSSTTLASVPTPVPTPSSDEATTNGPIQSSSESNESSESIAKSESEFTTEISVSDHTSTIIFTTGYNNGTVVPWSSTLIPQISKPSSSPSSVPEIVTGYEGSASFITVSSWMIGLFSILSFVF